MNSERSKPVNSGRSRAFFLLIAFAVGMAIAGCVPDIETGPYVSDGSTPTPPVQETGTGISPEINAEQDLSYIDLQPGFKIRYFAQGLEAPRMMLPFEDHVLVSLTDAGKVVALIDDDMDGIAESESVFIESLQRPHGLEYDQGWYYIAEESRVIRVRDDDSDMKADEGTIEVIAELPSGQGHNTRSLLLTNGTLLVSVGSSCNVCIESDERRSAVLGCDPAGNNNCTIYASGIRNAVGLAADMDSGTVYATENGRDFLGEDLPPDEIIIIEQGKAYGWPFCYGKNIRDVGFGTAASCDIMEPSLVDLQAHSAPLGLHFYDAESFPEGYIGLLYVAYHGSWNRDVPTGYKVVAIDPETGEVSDFAAGWLQPDGTVLGRPVDVTEHNGDLLVSDDLTGDIYRIYYVEMK
jgi:glucose/arabinose dehydrogenase